MVLVHPRFLKTTLQILSCLATFNMITWALICNIIAVVKLYEQDYVSDNSQMARILLGIPLRTNMNVPSNDFSNSRPILKNPSNSAISVESRAAPTITHEPQDHQSFLRTPNTKKIRGRSSTGWTIQVMWKMINSVVTKRTSPAHSTWEQNNECTRTGPKIMVCCEVEGVTMATHRWAGWSGKKWTSRFVLAHEQINNKVRIE